MEESLIDFDGIVLAGLELIEKHDWTRRCIKAKFPIIVIDEYQDLGLPLHRMILALMKKAAARVVAVGDPDQSIYGFTGAQPGLLRTLQTLPDVEPIELRLNYRCAGKIIAASKTLLTDPAEFKSHDGREGLLKIYKSKRDVKAQATYVFGTLIPGLLKENPTWKPGDIAMLYRTLYEGTPIAEAADACGIRYFRLDNGAPIKRSRLIDWLTDAAKWCAGGWQSGSVSLSTLLKTWRSLRPTLTRESDLIAARKKLISVLFASRDGSMSLRKWLEAVRKGVLDEMLNGEPGLADERDNLNDALEAAKEGSALQDYTVEIFGNQGRSPDLINLLTLHSSKGLEFEAVIMVGLEEGAFPSTRDNTKEKLEEATRLFYVGVTRAKSMIHLMYAFTESPFITKIRGATK